MFAFFESALMLLACFSLKGLVIFVSFTISPWFFLFLVPTGLLMGMAAAVTFDL